MLVLQIALGILLALAILSAIPMALAASEAVADAITPKRPPSLMSIAGWILLGIGILGNLVFAQEMFSGHITTKHLVNAGSRILVLPLFLLLPPGLGILLVAWARRLRRRVDSVGSKT